MTRRVGGWVAVAGGVLVVVSPLLPWVAGIEHAPDGPAHFHYTGWMAFTRASWLDGRMLVLLGALCVGGGLVALRSHGPIGEIVAILCGLAVASIGLLDRANVAQLGVLAQGLDSYDVTLTSAPGLPVLFVGAGLAVAGGLLCLGDWVLRPDERRSADVTL